MPKVTGVTIAVTAVLLLSLTGCAEATAEATETTAAEREYLDIITVKSERTGAELLEAGRRACDQIRQGRNILQVHVFPDDTNEDGFYRDSVEVALAAAPRLCPSY